MGKSLYLLKIQDPDPRNCYKVGSNKELDTAPYDQLDNDTINDEAEQVDTPPSEDAPPLIDDDDNNNDQDLKPEQQHEFDIKQEEEVTNVEDDQKKNNRLNAISTKKISIEKVCKILCATLYRDLNEYKCLKLGYLFLLSSFLKFLPSRCK